MKPMGKKDKKASKEIERLQALYRQQSAEVIPAEPRVDIKEPVPEPTVAASETKIVPVGPHAIVRRDLIFLSVLIVIMMAVLFALNYLAATTNFGDVIIRLFGGVF